jgi:hypothetical protein
MIQHIVAVRFAEQTTPAQQAQFVERFVALREQIGEVRTLEWGVNNSIEGLDRGFTHCFVLGFDSPAARDTYLPHAAHLAFVEHTRGWLEQVFVFDYAPQENAA